MAVKGQPAKQGKKPRAETSRQRWKRKSAYFAKGTQRERLNKERRLKRISRAAEKEVAAQHDPDSFYDRVWTLGLTRSTSTGS